MVVVREGKPEVFTTLRHPPRSGWRCCSCGGFTRGCQADVGSADRLDSHKSGAFHFQ